MPKRFYDIGQWQAVDDTYRSQCKNNKLYDTAETKKVKK
jgi:hypothetical protein